MALKKMRISFDIDIPVLLQMLGAANSGMKIDVFGDGAHAKPPKPPKTPKIAKHAPKQITGPKPRGGRNGTPTIYAIVLAYLLSNKTRDVPLGELGEAAAQAGCNRNSISPQLAKMRKLGHISKKTQTGMSRITDKGIEYFAAHYAPKESH